MYIFTRKEDNVIIETANELARWDNGYYLLDPLHDANNNGRVAIPNTDDIKMYEVEEIPEEVEIEKYCYTEKDGFYKNENYVEYKTPEQQMEELNQQITELQEAMAELVEGGAL